MSRFFPYPVLSVLLLVMWLLLSETLAPAQVLLGLVIAFLGPHLTARLESPRGRIRRPRAIFRLIGYVLADIVRSNLAVAKLCLSPSQEGFSSGFVNIPLDLRDLNALAVLSCIITAIPGTVWVSYDRSKNLLQIHVLDLVSDDIWHETIKQRYERLLMEIFE